MTRTHLFLVSLATLGLAACGGAADPEFLNATPSYDALAMDITAADSSEASASLLGDSPAQDPQRTERTLDDPCHPHLFARTHEVAARVNRHLVKYLGFVDAVIANHPKAKSGASHTWEKDRNGFTARFTMTKVDANNFTWKLEVAPQGGSNFVTVFSGKIDRTGAAGPHQGKGELTLDFTALKSVVPNEKVSGVVTAKFEVAADKRKLVVDGKDITWEVKDPLLPANVVAALQAPRSGHYVYFREPGNGGSLKMTDKMVFLCPGNPNLELADVDLVARWYRDASGQLKGRADAQMTGGQLPAHQITEVVGVTCYDSPTEGGDPAERYWMMKAEDGSGATLVAGSRQDNTYGAETCDAKFGDVPSMNDNSKDFAFGQVTFNDETPYPFPGMK